jgi:hypothetical protein
MTTTSTAATDTNAMNSIEVQFPTRAKARTAYYAVNRTPYASILDGATLIIGSADTAAASLLGWVATNLPDAGWMKVTPPVAN